MKTKISITLDDELLEFIKEKVKREHLNLSICINKELWESFQKQKL